MITTRGIPAASLASDRAFYLAASAAILIAVFVGFAPTY
jgi:hypothetical protein